MHANWRALGFANVAGDEPALTRSDGHALKVLLRLVSDGVVDETEALQLARVLGRTGARVARSFGETVLEPVLGSPQTPAEPEQLALLAERSMNDLQTLLVYSWRRHTAATLNRLTRATENAFTTVGFADLVDFTRLSRQLSDRDLTNLVSRFEERSCDVITAHGGRLIKSLGDEVLFTADAPSTAANIALQIMHNVSRHRIPGIRIGLEYGPVITHGGDVFGETVNLANRLTTKADPNHILIGPAITEALSHHTEFDVRTVAAVELRGFGAIAAASLRRHGGRPYLEVGSTLRR